MSDPELSPLYMTDAQRAQMLVPAQDQLSEILNSASPQLIYASLMSGQQKARGGMVHGYAHGGKTYTNDIHTVNMDQNKLADWIQNSPDAANLRSQMDVQRAPYEPPPRKPILPVQPPASIQPSQHQDDIGALLQEYASPQGQQYVHDIVNMPKKAKGGRVEPTEAQKHAGNYKKDHVRVHGMDVAIENRAGSFRRGKDKDGKEWSVRMPVHYGYIKRTEGADGDHVDVFIGPHQSDHVHVIDQVHADDPDKFDEHKVMMGFKTPAEAFDAYRSSFSDGKGHLRAGAISPMHVDDFKHWLKHGDTKKPMVAHFAKGGHVQSIMHRFHQPVKQQTFVKPNAHYRDAMGNDDLAKQRNFMREASGGR